MINAIFTKKDNKLTGFTIKGHAGFDDEGHDIICASVSALVINTVNSIEKFTDDNFEESEDEKAGLISLYIKGNVSEKSELLLNSLLLGINQISEISDGDFLNLEIKEV